MKKTNWALYIEMTLYVAQPTSIKPHTIQLQTENHYLKGTMQYPSLSEKLVWWRFFLWDSNMAPIYFNRVAHPAHLLKIFSPIQHLHQWYHFPLSCLCNRCDAPRRRPISQSKGIKTQQRVQWRHVTLGKLTSFWRFFWPLLIFQRDHALNTYNFRSKVIQSASLQAALFVLCFKWRKNGCSTLTDHRRQNHCAAMLPVWYPVQSMDSAYHPLPPPTN